MIEVLKQMQEALREYHYYTIGTGSPNQSMLNKGYTAYQAGKQAIAELQSQEPVAWMHTKIDGVAVPYRPVDLDKYPERWEALYKTPPPCPTCEALCRTVMLDQTSHDTHPPQRTWVGLTDEEVELYWDWEDFQTGAGRLTILKMVRDIEAKLKEKNNA